MVNTPNRDLHLPSTKLPDGRNVPAYQAELSLRILEGVAAGKTVVEMCKQPGMPSTSTFYRWVVMIPELTAAFNAARELSAQAMEEEAIQAGRDIKESPESGTKVRAYEVYMNQLRWSAARRDPSKYADRAAVSVRVPIQINTGLALGPGEAKDGAGQDNMYTVTAEVQTPSVEAEDAQFIDVPPQETTQLRTPGRTPNKISKKVKLTPRNPLWRASGHVNRTGEHMKMKKENRNANSASLPAREHGGVSSTSEQDGRPKEAG